MRQKKKTETNQNQHNTFEDATPLCQLSHDAGNHVLVNSQIHRMHPVERDVPDVEASDKEKC